MERTCQYFGSIEGPMFVIGVILMAVALAYLALNKEQRDRLTRHIKISGRRVSSAATPHRSLSPEKCASVDNPYGDILPPSRRQALSHISHVSLPLVSTFFVGRDVTDVDILKSLLPMNANYNTCPAKYTPTGLSTEEVKALGDFPDYATLSGVPLPNPYFEFKLEKAKPRPYRPFRWNYHQTMSLTRMETDWWLELDQDYRSRIAQRKELYLKHGKAVLDYLPGSELACKELMEMAVQFLCARYPQYFSLSSEKRHFHNGILGTKDDLKTKHPLVILMDNIPEDFAIMLRDDKTGYYVLCAGVICSALGWNLESKMGLQLHQIHAPIPDYKEKMQFSMDRYFSKMPTDKPIQRGSWGLEVGQPLFMPRGDPHELHRLSQNPSLSLSECNMRVDWQTLRRLPLSSSIVFNFKALFTPVAEFRDEPGVPKLIAKILKEGKRSILEYKNTWHVEHVVVPALEKWADEQEENGLVEKGWEVNTLDESPWFKGWEEKWHRQQGF
ncbi:hypothetical protein AJ78_00700 [Emergomyces pasteurianus Ep9510]|uniref:Alpha-1,2-mannosyltransferase n=1 Tax=Emergomyces pasteurianus Ep9510 TaxID=1447872 RepID=A0A1J9PTW4_9EURO|nr:hypothetical protein AJ78_00700 [Emergomyces pasteurianus Ep9510]